MKHQYGESMSSLENNDNNIENNIFEQLEQLIVDEQRLLLRFKSFCEDIIVSDDDGMDFEDKEEILLEKASKIVNKLLSNILEKTEYILVSFKIVPVKSKFEFIISNDNDEMSFILKVDEDGFELLES